MGDGMVWCEWLTEYDGKHVKVTGMRCSHGMSLLIEQNGITRPFTSLAN